MSIYPITEERLPVFTLLGHSNADGWTGTTNLFTNYPHLLPKTAVPLTDPANAWYKNVYVFTSEHPWPGTAGTPATTLISDGEWLELCVGVPDTPLMPWPHPSPFVYPNNQGATYAHWYYKAYTGLGVVTSGYGEHIFPTGGNSGQGVRHGVELPFQWFWRNHWNKQVGFVKLAFGSSFMLPQDSGELAFHWFNVGEFTPADTTNFIPGTVDTVNQGYDYMSWWTPIDNWDFAPSTHRFFQRWLDKMRGAQAALPAGSKMDVRLIIDWLGDNDANSKEVEALGTIKEFIKTFIYQQRKACVDNDWTTLPLEQIPVVWMDIHTAYDEGSPSSREFMNDTLREIEADDPFLRVIATEDLPVMADDGELSAIDTFSHFGSRGYYMAAEQIYEAYVDMASEPWDAIAVNDLVTVSEVKDRVRTYYLRGRVQTDASDATLLQHINGSLNSIINACGDNAYWLRRRTSGTFAVGAGQITSMPLFVHRLLKIEDAVDPRDGLPFQEIGRSDGGKLQIQLMSRGRNNPSSTSSTSGYNYQYIVRPRDVTLDTEYVPLPRQLLEWLVVDVCRRLSRSAGNVTLQASLEGEARELRERSLKEMLVNQRARKDRLAAVRKWPQIRYRR